MGPERPGQQEGPSDLEGQGRQERRGAWFDIRTSFITGVVVAAPIGITVYLAYAFVSFVDDRVAGLQRLLPDKYEPLNYLPFTVPGVGVLFVFIALTLLGAFTAHVSGRWFIGLWQRVLTRMPVVRNVYGGLRQIFETVMMESDNSFKQVALVEYPRKGVWAIAFVTAGVRGEIRARMGDDLLSLFLPTTPNPTSGFLLFARRADVIILDMTVEEGAKMVISGGLVVPEHTTPAERAFEKAEIRGPRLRPGRAPVEDAGEAEPPAAAAQ